MELKKEYVFEDLSQPLYYVSKDDLTVAKPYIPNNYDLEYGYGNFREERVPLYFSIDGALSSLDNINPKDKFNVYEAVDINREFIYIPTIDEAPRSCFNNEMWYNTDVPLKKVGEIIIDSEKDCNIPYKHGKIKLWNYSEIKPQVKDARSIYEIEQVLLRSGKFSEPHRRHMAAVSMHKKEVEAEEKARKSKEEAEKLLKNDPRKYIVINSEGNVIFEGDIVETNEFLEFNKRENLKKFPKEQFKDLSENELKDLFEKGE